MVRSESVTRAMQRNDSLTKVVQPEVTFSLPPQLPQRQPTMSQQSQQSLQSLQSQMTYQSQQSQLTQLSQQSQATQQSWRQPSADLATPRLNQHQEQLQQIERLHQQMAQLMSSGASTGAEVQPAQGPLPKETSVEDVSKWNPFEQLLQDLPTAGRNKARAETSSKLRDTMGVFGLPQPPTPTAQAGRSANQDAETTSFVGQCSPSPSRVGSGGRFASPEEMPTSFILAQPPAASPAAKVNCGGDASDSFGRACRGEQPPFAADPPSPPHKLQTHTAGFRDRLDLAAVASGVPDSIPGSRGETEPLTQTMQDKVSPSRGATPDKVRLSKPRPEIVQLTEAPESFSRADQMLRDAVSQVSLRDLSELRSFRNPPAVVCQVLEAVAVVLGMPDSRWSYMRKQLDKSILERLCSFDPASLAPSQEERLRTLLQVPVFSDGSLAERCAAVAALAQWCNVVGKLMDGETDFEVEQMQAAMPLSAKPNLGGLLVTPDLWSMAEDQLAQVDELTIEREGVGCVTFHGKTDCRELAQNLPDVVVLNPGEVVVYPNHKVKPSIGSGLNKPASIKLYGCHPKTQNFASERAREKYKNRVRVMTEEKGAEFVDYDCDHGIWEFRVSHF